MAKKVESESYDIRSALSPGQKRELRNAIRTQSEQLLILRKVRYLDGGDDNISILTEGSDLPYRSGPTSPEPIAADGGVSGYLDAADVDNEASEPTDGPDPADLVGSNPLKPDGPDPADLMCSTAAPIHYKKDGFLAMANAGRFFLTFVPRGGTRKPGLGGRKPKGSILGGTKTEGSKLGGTETKGPKPWGGRNQTL